MAWEGEEGATKQKKYYYETSWLIVQTEITWFYLAALEGEIFYSLLVEQIINSYK